MFLDADRPPDFLAVFIFPLTRRLKPQYLLFLLKCQSLLKPKRVYRQHTPMGSKGVDTTAVSHKQFRIAWPFSGCGDKEAACAVIPASLSETHLEEDVALESDWVTCHQPSLSKT